MFWFTIISILSASSPEVTQSLAFTVSYKLPGDENSREKRILLDLYGNKCPNTVKNFFQIATNEDPNSKNYLNSIFHRVVKDFVIQGGDVINRNGTGEYSIFGHPFEDEINEPNQHVRGSLSMANRGKNTNGSQFFIVTAENAKHLDGLHTVFGKVRAESFDIIMEINNVEVNKMNHMPLNDVKITKIENITGVQTKGEMNNQADTPVQPAENGQQIDSGVANHDKQVDAPNKLGKESHQRDVISDDEGFGSSFIDSLTPEQLQMLLRQLKEENEEYGHEEL